MNLYCPLRNELIRALVPPSLKSHGGDIMAKGETTLAVFVSQLVNPSLLSLIRQQQSQPHSGVLCCILLRCSAFRNPGASSLMRTGQDTPTKGRKPVGHYRWKRAMVWFMLQKDHLETGCEMHQEGREF